MKPAIPTLLLAAALSTSVFGALTAAPIDAPLAARTETALPVTEPAPKAPGILLASGDDKGFWNLLDWDDDDDDHRHHGKGHGHDDDDDDDDDRFGGGACPAGQSGCATAGSPAPAGTAEPPANGLFTPGAKPKVQTN